MFGSQISLRVENAAGVVNFIPFPLRDGARHHVDAVFLRRLRNFRRSGAWDRLRVLARQKYTIKGSHEFKTINGEKIEDYRDIFVGRSFRYFEGPHEVQAWNIKKIQIY